MPMPKLGAILLRPADDNEWRENVSLLRRMKGEVAKIHVSVGFGTSWQDVEYLIAENPQLTTIIYRTEDSIISYESVESDIVANGHWAMIQRFPQIEHWIEVGNEPEMVPLDHWVYRWLLLDTVTKLKPKFPGLKWIASMPTRLDHTIDVLARDQHGRVQDLYDAIGFHVYGHTRLTDGGSGGWLNIYQYLLTKTTLPLYLTEFGINDDKTSKAEKGKRYLDWLSRQPDRLVAATVFVIGKWEHDRYRVDAAMADVLGSRSLPTPQPQPEPEPDMPLQLDHEWFGRDDITAEQIVAAISAHGQPAYSREQVETYAASMVYRTREFGLRTLAVAAQSAVETNWLKFGGQVKPEQFNFGGIGADDSGAAGATNPTIDHGVVQMCVHHLAYQLGMPDKWPAELRQYAHTDDRIDDVVGLLKDRKLTGKVKRIRDYGRGIWATDPDYAGKIIDRAREIAAQPHEEPEQEQPPMATIPTEADLGYPVRVIWAADQGPRRALSSVVWFVVHKTEGREAGDIPTLTRPTNPVASCHLWIRRDGHAVFMVPLDVTAWTSGNSEVDEFAINVELEGFVREDTTDAQYRCMAAFFRWCIARGAQIPAEYVGYEDRPGILGHQHVSDPDDPGMWGGFANHTDPGARFDWNRFVAYIGQAQPTEPQPECIEFQETGFSLCRGFLRFWQEFGGLAVFGYPITNEMQEAGKDGVIRTVQYFERARFEWHPGTWPEKYDVLLGHLGHEVWDYREEIDRLNQRIAELEAADE